MALVLEQRSTALNPKAPVFIPSVYRQVEDFSPEWWELVKTSPWFRDFWLSEHPEGTFDGVFDELSLEKFDEEDQFDELMKFGEDTEEKKKKKPLDGVTFDLQGLLKELSIPSSGKWRNAESPPGNAVKRGKKGGYWMNTKTSPRRIRQIHQPR
ncbi:Protein EARLY RESPONSIVE TO DEHYDRATION 15 [Euphorbia peplus]|nr:Protein EARLY RESPONSIVE TO DEHYDRATION 15 [Euphorbia peplus]